LFDSQTRQITELNGRPHGGFQVQTRVVAKYCFLGSSRLL
jgi:hypothetical protein